MSSFYVKDHRLDDDDFYCQKVEEYQKTHPIKLNSLGIPEKADRVVYSDYYINNLVRDVIKSTGREVLPEYILGSLRDLPLTSLPVETNMFFHKSMEFHLYHKIGTHFLCPGQRYNHIPGHEHMVNKDEAAWNTRNYGDYYKDRLHCFDPWKFLPYTLDLSNKEQCLEIIIELKNDNDPDTVK